MIETAAEVENELIILFGVAPIFWLLKPMDYFCPLKVEKAMGLSMGA